MILVVLLVLALFVLQTLLPSRFREPPAPEGPSRLAENLGNRDRVRPLTTIGGRAARALTNMQEALPVFVTLALLNLIIAPQAATAVSGAWVFLIARVAYVPLYLAGVAYVRTVAWTAGWVGLGMMAVPLLRALP